MDQQQQQQQQQQQPPPPPPSQPQGVPKRDESRPALYEIGKDGHYGACQQIANAGQAPDSTLYTGPWTNVNQGLTGHYRDVLSTYWQGQLRHLEDAEHDYKQQQLPLARIKKVMKADPEVKMISAEAPILFAKGCDIFITELTMRAWIHAEENKRRTLQRSDIASALSKSDMFDFLIDIVPREEANNPQKPRPAGSAPAAPAAPASMPPQMAQHHGGPPPHHPGAPEYGFQGHMPEHQDFRGPPTMYMPQGQPDPSQYGHPQPPMFDQNMYNQYAMQPQQ